MTHEVSVMCNCDDIENCRMERYIADIRTLLWCVVLILQGER